MAEPPPIERRGDDYVLRLHGPEVRYRITVPGALIDEEIGPTADDAARRAWIERNLPGILGAATARETGGFMDPPWGRLLIEEIP